MRLYSCIAVILTLSCKPSAAMIDSEEISEFATSEIADNFNNDDNRDDHFEFNEQGGRGGGGGGRPKDDHWDAILKLAKKNQILAEKVSQLPKMIKKACKTALPQGGGALDQNKNMFGPERIVIIRQSSVESSSSSSESSSKSDSSKKEKSGSSEDSKAWPGQNSMEKSAYMDNGFDSYGRDAGAGGGYGMHHGHGHHHGNGQHGFRPGHGHTHGSGHDRYGRNSGRRSNKRNEYTPGNIPHYNMRHKSLPHRFKDHKQMHGY